MGKKTISRKKQDTSNNGKKAKTIAKCPSCSKTPKSKQTNFCVCKTGIVNIGNSCYISSVLQTIAELGIYSTVQEDSQLYLLLSLLNTAMPSALSPDLALFEVQNLWTHESIQEDAFDFFLTILPLLESSRFTFEYLSQRICEQCGYTCEAVVREDCSIHMNVNGTSLQEQVNGTIEPIDEICKSCSKGYMMRLTNIMKPPEILTVKIVRFQVNGKTGKFSKFWNKVAIPEEVFIGERVYKLEVVILHKSKTLSHGHYAVYLPRKKIVIDDEKVQYNKTLKLDYSYFYVAFYV